MKNLGTLLVLALLFLSWLISRSVRNTDDSGTAAFSRRPSRVPKAGYHSGAER